MKKSELIQLIKEEIKLALSEKINFSLGSEGNPNKPIGDNFRIVFKDPRKAELVMMEINKELEKPIEYKNVGFIIKNPTYNQMNTILNKFNDSDIESIGRVLNKEI